MDPQVRRRPLAVRTYTETGPPAEARRNGRGPDTSTETVRRARTFAAEDSGPFSPHTPESCDYPGRRAWPEDPPGYFDGARRHGSATGGEPIRRNDPRDWSSASRECVVNQGPGGFTNQPPIGLDHGGRRGAAKGAQGYVATDGLRSLKGSKEVSPNGGPGYFPEHRPRAMEGPRPSGFANGNRPGSSRSHRGGLAGIEVPQGFDHRPRTAVNRTNSNLSLMPPPSPSLYPPSPLSPMSPISPLRHIRSATNLQAAHDRPSTAVADPRGELPVDFVVDDLPTPPSGRLSPQITSGTGPNEIRRVKSSSALSVGGATIENGLIASTANGASAAPTAAQKWKAALGEAQYFAGGLVSHPAESTRHYSIIRHSHALVWYRGPSTSISITILSDVDMPPPGSRSVWMQQKGYSGGMGMSIKALVGGTGSWIDVTPATRAAPADLPAVDERGIQRDLKRFAKKASGRAKRHVPRETLVIRIPASAVDGYFRLVVCAGTDENARKKSTLCGSPVFRVASTTTDISVTRGASLSTMPLEVGVKVASTVGQQVAKRYAGAATLVVQNKATSAVSKTVSKKALSHISKGVTVSRQVYETTGANKALADSWNKKRGNAGRYATAVFEETAVVSVIGSDEGPEPPFPVAFNGKVAQASGQSARELGIPTANIREVRDEVKMRMRGVFAAWACVLPRKGLEDISHDWHEAIVTIGPLRYAPPEVVVKNRIAVHFIHDFDEDCDNDSGGTTFYDARVKVVLMGHLHAPLSKDAEVEDVVRQHAEDTMTVLASLGRENWEAEDTVMRIKSERSFTDKLDGVTGSVQGKVDRMPLHWVGVRSEVGAMRDAAYGNGGLWIPR